jgi:arsenate reductase
VNRQLKRVLFVCIGNSCRSQMAEGFARAYGSDVLVPASAGLAPATRIAPDTLDAMDEKGIDLRDHFPKSIRHLGRVEFNLVINISGEPLPSTITCPIREWDVEDPVRLKYDDHCAVRDDIERLVMELILELRREQAQPDLRPPTSADRPPSVR